MYSNVSYISRRWVCFAARCGILLLAGCDQAATADRPATANGTAKPSFGVDGTGATSETWDAIFLQGTKVGCEQTVVRDVHDGRKEIRTDVNTRISIVRDRTTLVQDVAVTEWETPEGALLRFTCEIAMGTAPTVVTGTVEGNKLALKTATAGKVETSSLPWSAEIGGPRAAELSLLKKPIQPGEVRKLKQIEIGFFQIADVELKAADYEPTPLLDRTEKLLRIERTSSLPDGQSIQQIAWTNRAGDILKTRLAMLNNESFRCSKETALAQGSPVKFDLILNNFVKPDRPIDNPHGTKRIRYRVQVEERDPAKIFPTGATQHVKPIDANTAELTVTAIRGDDPPTDKNGDAAADAKPTDDDRNPNNLIQSDDKKVVELARQAAGDETDPWKVAVKLEKFVNHYIKKKNFDTGFATAAEVAAKPEGDCTEHAVLLAALARARGLPARCCIGLVYVNGTGFGYHMWTEVWVADRWVPLDATLGHGGIGAAHLKLASTNLKGASAFSAFLPVMHVMGKLKVKVLEVE